MKNVIKISFILFLMVFQIEAQVVIKEKVKIKPHESRAAAVQIKTDYAPLEFYIGGPLPFSTTVSGPTASVSGSGGGSSNPTVILQLSAENGNYSISVSSLLSAGQRTNIGITIAWGSMGGIYNTERWLYNGSSESAVISTVVNYTFNLIPVEPTYCDFTFEMSLSQICDTKRMAAMGAQLFSTPDCAGAIMLKNSSPITISIESTPAEVSLYDLNTGEYVESPLVTTFNQLYSIRLKLIKPNISDADINVIIAAEAAGLIRKDTVIISSVKELMQYKINKSPDDAEPIDYGSIVYAEFWADRGGSCGIPFTYLPDSIKYSLKIIKGVEYGSIHFTNTPDGNEISGTELYSLDHVEGWNYFLYFSDGLEPLQEDTVIIRVSTTDPQIEPAYIIFLIQPPKMSVVFEPAVISPGDISNIIIEKIDDAGNKQPFPPGQLFYLYTMSGENYGCLVSATGLSGDYIDNDPGAFTFVAYDSMDVDTAEVFVNAGTFDTDGPMAGNVVASSKSVNFFLLRPAARGKMMNRAEAVKNIQAAQAKTNLNKTAGKNIQSAYPGQWLSRTGKLIIVKQEDIKLEIEITGKSEIWPLNSTAPGYEPKTTAKVTAKKGNEALAGADVKLLIKRIEGTGGHDHIFPALPVDKCGRINSRTNGTVVLKTNANGVIDNIEIESSEFGGDYILEASLKNSPAIKAEVEFKVRVPELKPLPSSMYYDKIGGTDKHLGPPKFPDKDHNHYGTNSLNENLLSLSIGWYNLYENARILNINDMSLEYGGRFDIGGKWTGKHSEHRIGRNTDLRSKDMLGERWKDKKPYNGFWDPGELILNDNGDGVCDDFQLKTFSLKAKRAGFSNAFLELPLDNNEHWHLTN